VVIRIVIKVWGDIMYFDKIVSLQVLYFLHVDKKNSNKNPKLKKDPFLLKKKLKSSE
jgi:hypothetical protein